MKTGVYHAGKFLVKFVFGCVERIHVRGDENVNRVGGFLWASNQISHFDPFLIGLWVRRKIDWMTMAEFFRPPALGFLLHSIDAFPAERDRADLKTIRTAIERLKSRRIVGLFPEGGIRDGARSLLEGAPLRPGAATLAQLAGVPVVPCVILGTDRLYQKTQWLPFRRTPVWIAFGKPISCFPELQKSQARKRIESELAAAFKNLYAELREKFRLMADDLPHSPQMRTGCCTASAPLARSCAGNRSGCPTIARRSLHSFSSATVDSLLCASINWLHKRHPLNGHSRQNMERYVTRCERLSPQEYYTTPRAISGNGEPDSKPRIEAIRDSRIAKLSWCSPVETEFAANNVARADFLRCNAWKWESAPTVFLLHSLMSASPTGYYRWAEKFN